MSPPSGPATIANGSFSLPSPKTNSPAPTKLPPKTDLCCKTSRRCPPPMPSADAKTEPRFIAVWCEPSTPQEEHRAVIDVSQAELTAAQTKLQNQNIVSQTAISVRTDTAGQRRYTALFSNLGTPTKLSAVYSGLTLGDELQWDIQLGNLDAALVDLDFLVGQASSLPSSVLQYRTLTLARLGKSDEAKESLAKYLATNPPASYQAYVRMQVPACLGESAQASTELESSVTALGANSDDLYNVACAAALCSRHAIQPSRSTSRIGRWNCCNKS